VPDERTIESDIAPRSPVEPQTAPLRAPQSQAPQTHEAGNAPQIQASNPQVAAKQESVTPVSMAPPFIVRSLSSRSRLNFIFLSVCLPAAGALLASTWALGAIVAGLLTVILIEFFFIYVRKDSENSFLEASSLVSALFVSLLVPADFPFFLVPLGVVFAIVVVKKPFGGLGHNIFNPAAAGFLFLYLSFPTLMVALHEPRVIFMERSSESVAVAVVDSTNPLERSSLLFGNSALGSGSANKVMVLAGGLMAVLLARADILVPAMSILTLAFMGAFAGGMNAGELAALVLGGNTLLVFLLMAIDPVTTPLSRRGRLLFAALLGVLTYAALTKSSAGACFALLAANALTPIIDRFTAGRKRRRHDI
jgi:Na+-translocating ferredoxin:NAD+ oxidoreductase subunit D